MQYVDNFNDYLIMIFSKLFAVFVCLSEDLCFALYIYYIYIIIYYIILYM